MLSSLFGGDGLSSVLGALCSYTGLDSGMMKNILGYISPLVLGAVGSHFKGSNINPQGLMSFFSDQHANIASAMPAGLSLPTTGEPTTVEYAEAAPAVAAHTEKSPGWVLPLLALALLGGLYYWWTSTHPEKATETVERKPVPTATPQVKPEPSPIETSVPDFSNAGTLLSSTYSKLGDTLAGVKDVPSAEAALPTLKSIDNRVGNMNALLEKMPADTRSELKTVSSEHFSKLKDKVSELMANPAIAEVLKPTLDHILSGLSSLG